MKCAVSSSSCGTKMRVQSQCMYATRPLKCRCNVSTSSLVSCLVSCLLYASFHLFFCDDAVVRRTLVLIAFTVAIVFIVATLRRISLHWKYSVYTSWCSGWPTTLGVGVGLSFFGWELVLSLWCGSCPFLLGGCPFVLCGGSWPSLLSFSGSWPFLEWGLAPGPAFSECGRWPFCLRLGCWPFLLEVRGGPHFSGPRPCLCGALPPIRHSSNNRCPSVRQNELLRATSLLHRSPLSYF